LGIDYKTALDLWSPLNASNLSPTLGIGLMSNLPLGSSNIKREALNTREERAEDVGI
jgi:hypothetical protein